jgi:DNA-directed RNA polymerase specialized sigma24 family protein
MRASWSAIQVSFTSVLNRTSAETAFTAMFQFHPELARFPSIAAVMEHQHSAMTDAAIRFGVIRILVAAAQSDQAFRSTAQIMVIVALWPGLDTVYWRLWRGFPNARSDLAAEIIARLAEAIATLDLKRVSSVTATLLRNLERDVRRYLVRARQTAGAILPISDPAIEAQTTLLSWHGNPEPRLLDDCLVDLGPRDANLLTRVFLVGETQEEAGRALGLGAAAARKRFQRALRKLRSDEKSSPALSHSVRPIGL